jgi:nucleotide-binding universal stress UspA family protein
MFKTILVATDGSEHAANALATGCMLARELGSDLHLIHTPELQTTAYAVGASAVVVSNTPEEVAEAGEKVISDARATAEGAGCQIASSQVQQGDPAHAIETHATKIGADLIITGRRGLGKIGGLLMGSVSQKLGQIAPCAHMTVK